MKVDLTCPVELWQCIMPTQEEPTCVFRFNNLSEKTVTSVQVTMISLNTAGEPIYRQVERIQGINADARERFTITVLPAQWDETVSVDLVIEKVWFDDAIIWRRYDSSLTEYEPNGLAPGRKLDELRFVAGQDAIGYPLMEEFVWVCVCGRANEKAAKRCARCGRQTEAVFANYRPQTVDLIIAAHERKRQDIAKKAREDASKLLEEQGKKQKQRKRLNRNIAVVIISLLLITAAALVTMLWVIPEKRYSHAEDLLQAGAFNEARSAFLAMGEYRDAPEQLVRCDYLEAKAWLDEGDMESLGRASAAFRDLADYEDCPNLWRQAEFLQGEILLEAGAFDIAAEHFSAAGRLEGVTEAHYLQASKLFDAGLYADAAGIFLEMADYRDSQEKARESNYRIALSARDAEEYDQAMGLLTGLGDYRDAQAQLQAVCYLLAEQKMAANEREGAGVLYLEAGDYLDARLKANDVLYQIAQEHYRTGDYERAGELFASIVPYLDSDSLSDECVYQQASVKLASGLYQEAAELFALVPRHKDATEKTKECLYQLANLSWTNENLEEAAELYASLGDFKDSERQLNQIQYQIAEGAVAQADFEKAAVLFDALGSYTDSAKRAQDCRYQIARNAFLELRYEVAINGFLALGNYEDSAKLLGIAAFEYAMEKKEAGDLEGALRFLALAEDNEETRRERIEISLAEAQKQRGDGQTDSANAVLNALSSDPELFEESCYAYAVQIDEEGNPYEAFPYYSLIPQYRDVAQRLERPCYQLLGKWISSTGLEVEFRPDGVCQIAGEPLMFNVLDSGLYTGVDKASLALTYQISSITEMGMILQNVQGASGVMLSFERIPDIEPTSQPTPAIEPTLNPLSEMLVQEDDDAPSKP